MTAVTPARLVEALSDWGCQPTAYEPGGVPWQRHTTPGAFHPVGVIHHHTAGSASLLTSETSQRAMLRLLRYGTASLGRAALAGEDADGLAAAVAEHLTCGFDDAHDLGPRPDPAARAAGIPGPLCHLAPAMVPGSRTRARVWLIGYANVNHAGRGSSRTLLAVRNGTFTGRAGPGRDDTDGNPWFWGMEYMHPGVDAVAWPDPLLEAGHRAGCAICQVQGWDLSSWPGSNIEHREWTDRKIDRSWRGDLRAAIRATIREGAPMAASTEDVTRFWTGVKVIHNENDPTPTPGPDWTPAQAMAKADTKLDNLKTQVTALTRQVEALTGLVQQLLTRR